MLLLPALNEMIDITTTRFVATQNHPPVAIFLLLAGLSLIGALLVGYEMAIITDAVGCTIWPLPPSCHFPSTSSSISSFHELVLSVFTVPIRYCWICSSRCSALRPLHNRSSSERGQ